MLKLSSLSLYFLTVILCFFFSDTNRPFKCDNCDTYYYRKNVLKAHIAKCQGPASQASKKSSPTSGCKEKRMNKQRSSMTIKSAKSFDIVDTKKK